MSSHTAPPPVEHFPPMGAAQYIGYTERTLAEWRRTGRGPHYVRVNGRTVRYSRTELDRWMAEQTFSSTSAESEARAVAS